MTMPNGRPSDTKVQMYAVNLVADAIPPYDVYTFVPGTWSVTWINNGAVNLLVRVPYTQQGGEFTLVPGAQLTIEDQDGRDIFVDCGVQAASATCAYQLLTLQYYQLPSNARPSHQ